MKRTPIAFIAPADYSHTSAWVRALSLAMPQCCVVALSDMEKETRQRCTVAIVANPDPADLLLLPKLQWVHSVWAGVEKLVADLGDTSLPIVRLVDPQLARTMAEAVLAYTLYLHRDMPAYAHQQAQRRWQSLEYVRPENRTVSVLGLGALGTAAAKRLSDGGFRVCGWSQNLKQISGIETFAGQSGFSTLLENTDILVCLLPLTPKTRGLLGAEAFAMLRTGASLINFSRGAVVNDADLKEALDSGRLRHAVLDVFEVEPLPSTQWHWGHAAVTVLPHCSAPTDRETASLIVANNILRYLKEGIIPAGVDRSRGY